MISFKDLRPLVSKTDSISIMLKSIGDVFENYLTIDLVPDRFDKFPVIGFGGCDHIPILNEERDYPIMKGMEFYLDDTNTENQ